MADSNDISLWNRYREGDNRALSDIYQLNIVSLYNYGLKFTSNSELIEDCIQDLFVLLLDKRKSVSETDNIRFYLLRSLRNSLIRKLQKESKSSIYSSEISFSTSYNIESQTINEESEEKTREFLVRVLKDLSPRQKEALYLKYADGLSYEEISQIMSINYQACRNTIYKALKKLKHVVRKENFDKNELILLVINTSKFY